jgi:DNA helicase-2/ATP-dependent DNA helicase PcrA
LRQFGTDIGIPSGFVVYDEEDRRTLLRQVIRELSLSERDYPVWRVASAVSARKNAAFSADRFQRWQNPRDQEVLESVVQHYQSLLQSNGGLDFDDLLLRCIELLECSEAAQAFAERRFQHVLVDEYQDTNRVQYRLLRLLAPHGNLFVVGDEDQSIYNFRGADLRNILDFEKDFPETQIFKLEKNYRSTGAILAAAGALIAKNRERKGKRLIPHLDEGTKPIIYQAEDELEEASYVAGRIQALQKETGRRVAVLYRTNAQSRAFEEELISRGIPHLLVGGQRFYERKEIKDALAYLKLVLNPSDNTSFGRVANVPTRGVGGASLALIRQAAEENDVSLWEATASLLDGAALPSRAHNGLTRFREIVQSLSSQAKALSLAELVDATITASELPKSFERESPVQKQTRLENLAQLTAAAADYQEREEDVTLAGFLDNVSLLTDMDTVKDEAPCLLMTLHAAKGLEFDAVFLTGLEEGLFPHTLSLGNTRSVEEERRLCYVGMTRAKRLLTLTYALMRRAALQQADRSPSRFLGEIPGALLELGSSGHRAPSSSPKKTASRFRKGMTVRHSLFGEGSIVAVENKGADQKVTVVFRKAGRKKLMTKFAELEILSKPGRSLYS